MKPILSVRDLASRLGTTPSRLNEVASSIESHYVVVPLEANGKIRILHVPRDELMQIQRGIKTSVLDKIGFAEVAHGGVRGRSPRTNAVQHLAQRCVVTVDVRGFFPSVRHYVVYRMFRHELGFGRDVARLLTRLTTLKSRLPQGTPTSTAIANLLLATPVDAPLVRLAQQQDVRYTRFVDDITMSGPNPRPLINVVARMLSRRRLQMHRKKARWTTKAKLKIRSRGAPQEVTGLVVNSARGPTISRTRRDAVRAAIYELKRLPERELAHAVQSVRGRISHVRQFNNEAATRLQKYLDETLAIV